MRALYKGWVTHPDLGPVSDSLITRVDFGRLDSENDDKLLDYFLTTGMAQSAARGAQLVVGRKGSGKTAIFRHLSATLDGRVVQLDLLNYVFQVHRGLLDTGMAREFAYTSSWRLLIAASMFGAVRKEMGFWRRREGDRLLRKIGLGPNAGPVRSMFDWLTRVRRVDLPSVAGLLEVGGVEIAGKETQALDISTSKALDRLEEILCVAAQKCPVTVLIDRLDDAWTGDQKALDLIAGAVRASRHFATLLKQDGPAPVITFLRTDLWEKLSFNDRNKMSQDIIYLNWTDEQLAEVVDRRISSSAGIPEGEGWGRLFTGAEMRQRASAQRHMLKRALGRPRDIVAFSVFALEEARNRNHQLIEKEDIYASENRYSNHALEELRDEIERHVSDFSQVINTLKSLGRRTFSHGEWEEAALANGLSPDDAKVALEQLFEASAVGVHRTGGARGGSQTRYRYQDRHLRSSDEAQLQVHLAFVRELGIKDS
ncbi:P-loop ATPase, Sll1717 family [Micromonospora sp. NPDC000089]|uniref:P-loop ATPase, Sll1717 family n=1 Tax=unclassified Micromonospora TaxID=2617518 RepID=UPI003680A7F7